MLWHRIVRLSYTLCTNTNRHEEPYSQFSSGFKTEVCLTKTEYGGVIEFLFKEGLSPVQIKERLNSMYKEYSPFFNTVKVWVKEIRLGRETVEDISTDGRPKIIALMEEEVLSDSCLKNKDISVGLGLSKSTVHLAIHEHLHMKKSVQDGS